MRFHGFGLINMEKIYKDLSSEKNKEFAKLLSNQFSKTKIEEGKLTTGKVTKISEKLIFVYIPGCRAEGTIDVNELKLLKEFDNLEVGSDITVLLEKLENRDGDIVISREKALRFTNFDKLEKAFAKYGRNGWKSTTFSNKKDHQFFNLYINYDSNESA